MSGHFNLDMRGLQADLGRRQLPRTGNKQALQVRLVQHDKQHGNIAKKTTAVSFQELSATDSSSRDIGDSHDPANLVNESVLHWSLTDDGSNLKLYFKSGQMVNIEGDWAQRYVQVALDDNLHGSLQALTGCKDFDEHQGTKPDTPLRLTEASLARRVSVVSRCIGDDMVPSAWEETHIVLGLRLDGMKEMGYIYAYDSEEDSMSNGFGDVSVGRLQLGTYRKD